MEHYDWFELDGKRYDVKYRNEKNLVWASTYVNGNKVETYGTDVQTAYWAIKNHANIILHFRTGKV